MKRFTALFLVLCIILGAVPVFAQNEVEEVLREVKKRIEIPEDLTEFNYSENKYDESLRYDFYWTNEKGNKEISVSSDSKGRVVRYNYYEYADRNYDRVLIDYTLEDARRLADKFLQKAYAEYFDDEGDTLDLSEDVISNYRGYQKNFTIYYDRIHEGLKVESNRVTVRVVATKDKIYIQSVNASLDEDGKYVQGEDVFGEEEQNERYEEKFPIKFYYATDYSGEKPEVKLFYSIEKGYVSYLTGETLEKERFDRYAITEETAEDSMAMGTLNKNEGFTPQEKAELEAMQNLIKPEEIEKTLRSLKLLGMTEDMKLNEIYTYKSDEDYFVNIGFKGEERNLFAAYNGVTGEIININSYFTIYDEKKEAAADKNVPEEDIKAFIRALAGDKVDETAGEIEVDDTRAGYNLHRVVNDVAYYENSISVTYDIKDGIIRRYSLNWDKDVSSFPKPDTAIGMEKAREILFEKGESENVYVNTKDGYAKAVTLAQAVEIKAENGEESYSVKNKKTVYTDVEGHWAEKEIKVLWEHDIYIPGDKFTPNEPITKKDMISIFAGCTGDSSSLYLDSGTVGIAKESENAQEDEELNKPVTRKEGFAALCKVLGYGEVAEFDIYKSSYIDMEACGSAEILKAMGILKGDKARGEDYLTYAEAAVMVYRYLAK